MLETWVVEAAFLVPGFLGAVDALAAHLGGAGTIQRIPTIVAGHPLANLVLAMLTYLQVGVMVPLALLLLNRTGPAPAALGLTMPRWRRDIWPAAGLTAAGYGLVLALTIVLAPLIATRKSLFFAPAIGHLPRYYILYGVTAAAVTAIAEETLVSGYLLTRLEQFGWDPRRALALSLLLRTSYHVYYGLGFLLTIPFGYLLTRSFQKHRSLARPIVAHFLYDAVLFTTAVLAH